MNNLPALPPSPFWEQPNEDEPEAEIEEEIAQGMADLLAQAFGADLGFPIRDLVNDAKENATLTLLARIAVELATIRKILTTEAEDE